MIGGTYLDLKVQEPELALNTRRGSSSSPHRPPTSEIKFCRGCSSWGRRGAVDEALEKSKPEQVGESRQSQMLSLVLFGGKDGGAFESRPAGSGKHGRLWIQLAPIRESRERRRKPRCTRLGSRYSRPGPGRGKQPGGKRPGLRGRGDSATHPTTAALARGARPSCPGEAAARSRR